MGLIVDGERRVPSDTCEYYDERLNLPIGCNQLRCARCDGWVRSGPRGLGLKRGASIDLARLYAAADWRSLPFTEKRKRVLSTEKELRVHACRCRYWEADEIACIDYEDHDFANPDVPWKCAGHPEPTLPTRVGPLTIAANTDYPKLVRRILGGARPRPIAPNDMTDGAGLWLAWLYLYLAGLRASEALAAAIGEQVGDCEPLVVGRALYFFATFPRASGVDRLIASAEAEPNRVAVGYPIPEALFCPTLWQVLVARLAQRTKSADALDQRADEVARKVMLIPLASLSHEDLGPTDRIAVKRAELERGVARERRWLSSRGRPFDPSVYKINVDLWVNLFRRQRADVVLDALEHASSAFDDVEIRRWVADHIVEIDAAAPGRWRALMNLLSDWWRKPETGHLIVVAGMRVIQSGIASAAEFRDWIEQRRVYGWVDDAWVLPLTSALPN